MDLADTIDKPQQQIVKALDEIRCHKKGMDLFASEMAQAIEKRDHDSLLIFYTAYSGLAAEICAGHWKALSAWENMTITPEIAVKMSPAFYVLLHFVPDVALKHRLFNEMLIALRRYAENFLHGTRYKELLEVITQKIATPQPSSGLSEMLQIHENLLLPRANQICKTNKGPARKEAARDEFPELRNRRLAFKGGRCNIEPSWISFNIMAARGLTHANAVSRSIIQTRKLHDALEAIRTMRA